MYIYIYIHILTHVAHAYAHAKAYTTCTYTHTDMLVGRSLSKQSLKLKCQALLQPPHFFVIRNVSHLDQHTWKLKTKFLQEGQLFCGFDQRKSETEYVRCLRVAKMCLLVCVCDGVRLCDCVTLLNFANDHSTRAQ